MARDNDTDVTEYSHDHHRRFLSTRERELRESLKRAPDYEAHIIRLELDSVHKQLADLDESIESFQRGLARRSAMLQRMHNLFRASDVESAQQALVEGDGTRADILFARLEGEQAEAIRRAATAAHQRALHARDQVRFGDARRHIARALRYSPDAYEIVRDAAHIYGLCGDRRTKRIYLEQAIRIASQEPGNPHMAEALTDLARFRHESGEHTEAEALYVRALDIERGEVGDFHPDVGSRLNHLANLYRDMNKSERAAELLEEALEIGRGTLGTDHPEYGVWMNNLAGIRRAQNRFAEAEDLIMQALEVARSTVGEWHPSYALRLNNLAGLRREQGELDEAEYYYKRAIEIDGEVLGEDHPAYAVDLNNLGSLYLEQGYLYEAEDLLQRSVSALSATLGEDDPATRAASRTLEKILLASS